MSALSLASPFPVFADLDGTPLEGGYVYVGISGLNPETNAIQTYWDAALTIPAGQPIRTIGGYPSRNGAAARVYVNADDCSILVKNKNGELVFSALTQTMRIPASLITFSQAPAAPAGTVGAKLQQEISAKDAPYNAGGDGTADDTSAMLAFFTAASGKKCSIPAGTYKITSLLTLPDLSNCVIEGVPGQTIITGSFGYALILLGALNNVHFKGITFESTYVNAAASSNTGVVYQGDSDCIDSSFLHCKFTTPDANTQGLVFFNRTNAGGADTCVIDGLWIEDSDFSEIGSTACTIMNRQETADKYSAAKRVYFNRNKGKNLGLLNTNTKGSLLSLDGFGSSFTVDGNEIDNPNGVGIENTGWSYGSLSHNKFRNFGGAGRRARAMSAADASPTTYPAVGLTVIGNACEDAAINGSYASFCNDSYFAGNVWRQTGAGIGSEKAFAFIDSNRNKVFGDKYVSDQSYAIRFQISTGTCQNNVIEDGYYDTSGSAANTAVINFDGANTSGNVTRGKVSKGTGGSNFTQTTSATNNLWGYESSGSGSLSLTFATPGDLNYVGTCPYRYVRNGKFVTLIFELDSTTFTWTTASGALRLTGFPFTVGTGNNYGVLSAFRGITKANYTQYAIRAVSGQTYAQVYASGSGQAVATLSASDMPTGGTVLLYGQITYEAAD